MYLKSESSIEAMKELADVIKQEMSVLESRVEREWPKPLQLKPWPDLSEYHPLQSPHEWFIQPKESVVDKNVVSLSVRYRELMAIVDKYEADVNAVREHNKKVVENNKAIHACVRKLMLYLGVQDARLGAKRVGDECKHTLMPAGYKADLELIAPTRVPEAPDVFQLKAKLMTSYNDECQALKQEKNVAVRQRLLQNLEQLAEKHLHKKNCNDVLAVLEAILDKDKYLQLAHYVLKARLDHNNESLAICCGLSLFDVSTEYDRAVYVTLNSGALNNKGLQRLYDVLISKVDEDLLIDYHKIKEIMAKL